MIKLRPTFANHKFDRKEFLTHPLAPLMVIEMDLDKIKWSMLSKNPAAIQLLEANPDKIRWFMLSKNPAAIHLLKANLDKIN